MTDSARLPGDPYDAGMAVRREVLGSEHVDRATDTSTEFTDEFQEMITRYAWGTIWTRDGLARRERSMITLTALIAGAHDSVCPPAEAEALAAGVARGRAAVVPSAAHLAPAEAPEETSRLLLDFFGADLMETAND